MAIARCSMSKKRRSGGSKGYLSTAAIVIVFLFILFLIYRSAAGGAYSDIPSPTRTPFVSATSQSGPAMEAYILDVGQADSIFLRSPSGKTMLVDAGEAGTFDVLDAFLKAQGVKKLDVVVATHPHSDHIGAMYKVINAYEIGAFYMPDVSHTTSTFERMIDALEKNDVPVKRAVADGESYLPWSDETAVRILSPLKGVDYGDDLNAWSVVLRVSYESSSILLTGDTEKPAEALMLEAYGASVFRSTVLKSAHHGSRTSGSDAFLDAVAPKIAMISCETDNDYGHPHKETLSRYAKRGIEVYRTDLMGTLHLVFTANGVTVEKEK